MGLRQTIAAQPEGGFFLADMQPLSEMRLREEKDTHQRSQSL